VPPLWCGPARPSAPGAARRAVERRSEAAGVLETLAAVADGIKVSAPFVGGFGTVRPALHPRRRPGVGRGPGPAGRDRRLRPGEGRGDRGHGRRRHDDPRRDPVVFWAPEAAQKCAEDRGTPVGAWCTDFHYRNVIDGLRTTPLDPGAIITLVPNGPPPASATLAQLAARVSNGCSSRASSTSTGRRHPGRPDRQRLSLHQGGLARGGAEARRRRGREGAFLKARATAGDCHRRVTLLRRAPSNLI